MKFNLKNKVAIITGGGSGIGKAISESFSEMGAIVNILDLNEEAGKQVAAELSAKHNPAYFYRCDVSSKINVDEVFEKINKANNGIDILVNNAGIGFVGNVENTTEEDMDRMYNVNIKGVFNCLKAVIPYFKEKKKGVIVNMASIASTVGITDRFAYSMTKGAVLTMTYSIAKDYLGDNIRCNSISPARVHTPFVDAFIAKNYPGKEEEMFENLSKTQPIGRMGKPQEIADLAVYLCSDEASFVTGTDFPIDGGFIKLNN
ncbi:SDR family NAD(P)-dependent oxidoreductase [Portibacter lacus]|uniref:Oxidoreductase n=1 Tax=Portibacter lacus TaxID=1099794 RepID=A0AA37SV50_9BACT|nr:SDR family oxidoreductase [Portibacter lacus]GLR18693.1 oxidoreductase [Portibacter lacus]